MGKHPKAARELLTLEAASDHIARHPSYLRRLVARREITYYKVGRLLRFDVADLDAYLDARRVEPW